MTNENQRGLISLAVFATAVTFGLSAFAWDMGEPIITYWAGPGYPGHPEKMTERAAQEFKAAGFNTVWGSTPAELDVAQKYGLRVFYDMRIDGRWFQTSNTVRLAQIAAEVERVKNHPALYFYRHCDEPWEGLFADLSRMHRWLKEHDPNHPTWINLLPTYANNEQLGIEGPILTAYREYVRRFFEMYQPEFISYDHYQLNCAYDTPNYLLNLSLVREAAAAAGIPFVNGVQTCTWVPGEAASPGSPRVPGVNELRFLVYTTAAYGAQGIYYYVYSCQGHRGSIVDIKTGALSDKYEALKTLNPTFAALAKELRRFRFVGAYLQGVQTQGATPYFDTALLKLSPAAPNVPMGKDGRFTDTTLVTRFDSPTEPTRLMVVNMDYTKKRAITVEGPSPLSRFNPLTRGWQSIGAKATLELDCGEGVLLRLAR